MNINHPEGTPQLPAYWRCLAAGFLACSFMAAVFQVYPGLGLTLSKAESLPVLGPVLLLWVSSVFIGVKFFQSGLFLLAHRDLPTAVVFGFTILGFFIAYIALALLYGFLSDTLSFFDSGGVAFLVAKDLFLALLASAIAAHGLRIHPGARVARGSVWRLWRPFYDGIDTSPPEGRSASGTDRLADLARRGIGINR